MTQTIEIIRISPSTLDELRRRAGNNHLDDLILNALAAYDDSLLLHDDLPVPQPENMGTPSSETDTLPSTDTSVDPAPPVEDAIVQDAADAPPPDNADQPANAPSFAPESSPEPEPQDHAPAVVTPPVERDDTPVAADCTDPAPVEAPSDDCAPPIAPEPELESVTSPEPQVAPEPAIVNDVADVAERDASSDPAPKRQVGDFPDLTIENCIPLPLSAGNKELAYTTPQIGHFDGQTVLLSSWFATLGIVVSHMWRKVGGNKDDLVRWINTSDLGIRARVGERHDCGFCPVDNLGISIRKVSAGKTWIAITRISKKFGISVDVRITWQENKPCRHPGKSGRLYSPV